MGKAILRGTRISSHAYWAVGGAPVPSLVLRQCLTKCRFFDRQMLSDLFHCFYVGNQDSGRLSGLDLLARTCTFADSSTSTIGTQKRRMSCSTTSTSNFSLNGNPFSGPKNPSCSPTSTEKKEPWNGEDHAFGYVTETLTLEDIFPELNWNGYE